MISSSLTKEITIKFSNIVSTPTNFIEEKKISLLISVTNLILNKKNTL